MKERVEKERHLPGEVWEALAPISVGGADIAKATAEIENLRTRAVALLDSGLTIEIESITILTDDPSAVPMLKATGKVAAVAP